MPETFLENPGYKYTYPEIFSNNYFCIPFEMMITTSLIFYNDSPTSKGIKSDTDMHKISSSNLSESIKKSTTLQPA